MKWVWRGNLWQQIKTIWVGDCNYANYTDTNSGEDDDNGDNNDDNKDGNDEDDADDDDGSGVHINHRSKGQQKDCQSLFTIIILASLFPLRIWQHIFDCYLRLY